jgi:malectin (di-glucose binding ER protein)
MIEINRTLRGAGLAAGTAFLWIQSAYSAETMNRYFAHETVQDQYGVIAPWYTGQNGQFDYRVRIASETLRRYPWVGKDRAAGIAPEYAFNNTWRITPEGVISIPKLENWLSGGRGQACARVIMGLIEYYRYSADPAALAHLEVVADTLVNFSQTGPNHPWPNFLISVPVTGVPYQQAREDGWIQLDIVAEAGVALLQAYQVTGNERWFDTVKHWADVFAEKRDRTPGAAPWGRYANPEVVKWGKTPEGNVQTGGIVYQLTMLDELIRLGYTGRNNSIVEARDAARVYLRDVLLPKWAVLDTWGRNYWDWEDPMQSQTTTDWAARYMMDHKEYFPNWKNDVRNILSIFLTHTSADPKSKGEVYSGAWAFPESSGCCDSSLAWGPMELALAFAQYGAEANDEWGREMARRQQILATYDVHDTGVVEDNIDGGQIAAGEWFNGTHPSALHWLLMTMGWIPDIMGPARENHLVRSSAVVNSVVYDKGDVRYSTFDAPANTVDTLRLAFEPTRITADGAALAKRSDLAANGYTTEALANGDFIVKVRHDGARRMSVQGRDPQQVLDDGALKYKGAWARVAEPQSWRGTLHTTSNTGAEVQIEFTGNQMRLIGAVSPKGGKAEIYLDGVKQLVGIDFWNPRELQQQVVYYRNGLSQGRHVIRVVTTGERNLLSAGNLVQVDAVQHSAATGANGFASGGGPTETQRMILGYTGRADYVDTSGHAWRPATEIVVRTGYLTDTVARTWLTMRQNVFTAGTKDRELYSYGVHAPDFTVNVTVGPGKYYVRLKFAENRFKRPNQRAMNIYLNDVKRVDRFDILGTAASLSLSKPDYYQGEPDGRSSRAVDLVFNDVAPKNGMIEVRLTGETVAGIPSDAILHAIEVGQGDGGEGARPVSASVR